MAESMIYDYYYGNESSQFSFYRIPPACHRAAVQKNLHRRKAAVWPPVRPYGAICPEWLV